MRFKRIRDLLIIIFGDSHFNSVLTRNAEAAYLRSQAEEMAILKAIKDAETPEALAYARGRRYQFSTARYWFSA